MSENYKIFTHRSCEFFPCHAGADPDNFNCLFCYCPLYALGRRCGGNFVYTDDGIKDCTNCLVPHIPKNYAYITSRYRDILEMVQLQDKQPQKARPNLQGAKKL